MKQSREKVNPDGSVDVEVMLNKKTKEYILQYVLNKQSINPQELFLQKKAARGNLTNALVSYGCVELLKEYIKDYDNDSNF